MFERLTKQGVRDLNSPGPGPEVISIAAWTCDHRKMRECCPGCGHYSCPCGISWDEGAEGPGPFSDSDDFWGLSMVSGVSGSVS